MAMTSSTGRAGTALALSAVCTLGIAALVVSGTDLVAAGVHTVDEVVAAGVHTLGLLLLGWYLITGIAAAACALVRASGRVWVVGERVVRAHGAPLARRLLVVGAGAAVAVTTVVAPATATPVEPDPTSTTSDDLGWGASAEPDEEPGVDPTSDETTETTSSPASVDAIPPDPTPSSPAAPAEETDGGQPLDDGDDLDEVDAGYVVVEGDSLWTIASAHLPADHDEGDVAAAWPLWYEANRGAIGADADLIHPGLVLQAPAQLPEEES